MRLRTATTSLVTEAVPDRSLPRKVVAADFNVPLGGDGGPSPTSSTAAHPVVEVRMETP